MFYLTLILVEQLSEYLRETLYSHALKCLQPAGFGILTLVCIHVCIRINGPLDRAPVAGTLKTRFREDEQKQDTIFKCRQRQHLPFRAFIFYLTLILLHHVGIFARNIVQPRVGWNTCSQPSLKSIYPGMYTYQLVGYSRPCSWGPENTVSRA